jgi:hypothetical protein
LRNQRLCPADGVADLVVHGVSQHGGHDQDEGEHERIERPGARQGPGREQQRVARQEGCDHQPRLAEHDHEQDEIGPQAVLRDELVQVAVQVQEDVDDLMQPFHRTRILAAAGPRVRRIPPPVVG